MEMQGLDTLAFATSGMGVEGEESEGWAGAEEEEEDDGSREVAPPIIQEQIAPSRKRKKVPKPAEPKQPAKKKATRGRGSRVNKGLRHFSIKVCEKLSQTGVTTYNDIANVLVEEARQAEGEGAAFDEKNIRRRIYDALNVLMAMDIISKEKKQIRWKGIRLAPENDCNRLAEVSRQVGDRIVKKKMLLEEMTLQYLSLRSLVERNEKNKDTVNDKEKLRLPFVIVNAQGDTDINCEMTDDRSTVFFNFSDAFSIHDDHTILKKLGILQTHSQGLVPRSLQPLLPAMFPSSSESQDRKSVV